VSDSDSRRHRDARNGAAASGTSIAECASVSSPGSPSTIVLDDVDAAIALCSIGGVVEAATDGARSLLLRMEIGVVPCPMPAEVWGELERRPPGEAVEWRPPYDGQYVLGCTRYRRREGYLLIMKELSDTHAALSRRLHQQRLESTGRLVAGIAHELRNSVASIVYSADLINAAGPSISADSLAEGIAEILAASGRLQDTVAGLLDFARLGPTVSVRVSLRDVLTRAQGFLRGVFRPSGSSLSIDIPSNAEWVQGNSIVIEQVFVNLLLNAVQSSRRPVHVHVSASTVAGGRFVRVRVADDGPGVPARIRESVFQPFFTTREQGTGLGLTNAREAAESLGGALDLEESATGACFVVLLPAAEAA
jgi:signal transduction histidine kinase